MEQVDGREHFLEGDDEALRNVFCSLDAGALSAASSVCRHWNTVISSGLLWNTLLWRDFGGFLEGAPRPYPPPPPTRGEMYHEQAAIAAFFGRSLSESDLAPHVDKLPSSRPSTPQPARRRVSSSPSALDDRTSRRLYRHFSRGMYSGHWRCFRRTLRAATQRCDVSDVIRVEQRGYCLSAYGAPAGDSRQAGREVFRLVLDETLTRASGHVQLFQDGSTCWARAVLKAVDEHALALRWTTTPLVDFEGPASSPELPFFCTRTFLRCSEEGEVFAAPAADVVEAPAADADTMSMASGTTEEEQLEMTTSFGEDDYYSEDDQFV